MFPALRSGFSESRDAEHGTCAGDDPFSAAW
jgi:hypothetical protein